MCVRVCVCMHTGLRCARWPPEEKSLAPGVEEKEEANEEDDDDGDD